MSDEKNSKYFYEKAFGNEYGDEVLYKLNQESLHNCYEEDFLKSVSFRRRQRLASRTVEKIILEKLKPKEKTEQHFFWSNLDNRKEMFSKLLEFPHIRTKELYLKPRFYNALKALFDKVSVLLFLDRKRLRSDVNLIIRSELFDAEWYEKTYDLKGDSNSLAQHYILSGCSRLYDPSKLFSTEKYFSANPDVFLEKANPLLHYIKFGKKEKRTIHPSNLKGNRR